MVTCLRGGLPPRWAPSERAGLQGLRRGAAGQRVALLQDTRPSAHSFCSFAALPPLDILSNSHSYHHCSARTAAAWRQNGGESGRWSPLTVRSSVGLEDLRCCVSRPGTPKRLVEGRRSGRTRTTTAKAPSQLCPAAVPSLLARGIQRRHELRRQRAGHRLVSGVSHCVGAGGGHWRVDDHLCRGEPAKRKGHEALRGRVG